MKEEVKLTPQGLEELTNIATKMKMKVSDLIALISIEDKNTFQLYLDDPNFNYSDNDKEFLTNLREKYISMLHSKNISIIDELLNATTKTKMKIGELFALISIEDKNTFQLYLDDPNYYFSDNDKEFLTNLREKYISILHSSNKAVNEELQSKSDQTIPRNQGDTPTGNYGDDVDFNPWDKIEPTKTNAKLEFDLTAEENEELSRAANRFGFELNEFISLICVEEENEFLAFINDFKYGFRDNEKAEFIRLRSKYLNIFHSRKATVSEALTSENGQSMPSNQGDTPTGNHGDDIGLTAEEMKELTDFAQKINWPLDKLISVILMDDSIFDTFINDPINKLTDSDKETLINLRNKCNKKMLDTVPDQAPVKNPVPESTPEVVKPKERRSVQSILKKIKHDPNSEDLDAQLSVSRFQAMMYKWSKTKIFQKYFESENRKGWVHATMKFASKALSTMISPLMKLTGKIFTKKATKEAMAALESNIGNLSEDEVDLLIREYSGSVIKQLNQPNYINGLLNARIYAERTKTIQEMQDTFIQKYNLLIGNYATIKAIDEKLKEPGLSDEDRRRYEEHKASLSLACGQGVVDLISLGSTLNREFSAGRHGQEEDLTKGTNDHKGGIFAHRANNDGEELATETPLLDEVMTHLGMSEYSELSARAVDISSLSPEKALLATKAFIDFEKYELEQSKISTSFVGRRLTSNRDYTIVPEGLDYTQDTIVRDFMFTVTIAASIINIIQSVKVAAAQNANQSSVDGVNAEIANRNAVIDQNNAQMVNVESAIRDIDKMVKDLQAKGMSVEEAQGAALDAYIRKTRGIDFDNSIETAELRGLISGSGPKYGPHFDRAQGYADVENELLNISRMPAGKARTDAYLDLAIRVTGDQRTFCASVIEPLKAYNTRITVRHPEWDLTHHISAMEAFANGASSITDGFKAVSDFLRHVESIRVPDVSFENLERINAINLETFNISPVTGGTILAGVASQARNQKPSDKTPVAEDKKKALLEKISHLSDEQVEEILNGTQPEETAKINKVPAAKK